MKAESFSKCSCYKIIAFIVMAGSWTAEETQALIAIWSQESVQDELKRVHRNRDIFHSSSACHTLLSTSNVYEKVTTT